MKCFACDHVLSKKTKASFVICADEQKVIVGPDCLKKIEASGTGGYQPPSGGPRLYTLANKPKAA